MNSKADQPLVIDPSALAGLEAADLVADWNAGEQIDISLLLEQVAGSPANGAGTIVPDTPLVLEPEGPGEIIVLDFGAGSLSGLLDDVPTTQTDL